MRSLVKVAAVAAVGRGDLARSATLYVGSLAERSLGSLVRAKLARVAVGVAAVGE